MIWIIIAVVVLLVIWLFSAYNGLITLKHKVDHAYATIEVALKERADLIPNLVETVKGATKFESETLENVIQLRNASLKPASIGDTIQTDAKLSQAMPQIMALAESYPQLKSNENFKDLSMRLTKVEDELANARRYYNGVVNAFNTKIELFPTSLLAGFAGCHNQPLFSVDDVSERKNIKVEF